MKIIEIKQNDAGRRLDKVLTAAFPLLPKSMMYKYIRLKKIKVNRKRAEIGQILNVGDTVELFIKEEFMEKEPRNDFFKNIRVNFGVIYEDENILLCDKPSGLLCYSDTAGEQNTPISTDKPPEKPRGMYRNISPVPSSHPSRCGTAGNPPGQQEVYQCIPYRSRRLPLHPCSR